jgi:hypothetical protein
MQVMPLGKKLACYCKLLRLQHTTCKNFTVLNGRKLQAKRAKWQNCKNEPVYLQKLVGKALRGFA